MDVVIVGAGQAAVALAAKLQGSLEHKIKITIIGDEMIEPYQRPPLSKAYLMGEIGLDRLFLRTHEFWKEKNIDLKLGQRVSRIDPDRKYVECGGEKISYDALVLATGSTPRHLPASIGGSLRGVYVLRNVADVDAIRHEFQASRRLLIVGGGYIGLEAAAVAAKLGLKVTLIELASRILSRVAAKETSDYFRELHESHGVRILEGIGLEKLLEGENGVSGAVLSDGQKIDVDFVIAGVGVMPNIDLAEAAGIKIDNGIATDVFGQTSVKDIWSAGDCASFPWKDGRIRLESVGNAIHQAEVVAENLMGAGQEYLARPWFWSDQYDCKLQIAGLNMNYDKVFTRSMPDGRLSVWYYANDELIALDAMNEPRAYMVGKKLIEAQKSPDPKLLADPDIPLKSFLENIVT